MILNHFTAFMIQKTQKQVYQRTRLFILLRYVINVAYGLTSGFGTRFGGAFGANFICRRTQKRKFSRANIVSITLEGNGDSKHKPSVLVVSAPLQLNSNNSNLKKKKKKTEKYLVTSIQIFD